MTAEKMKDFLFSLSFYEESVYHSRNVMEILADEYPGVDFSSVLPGGDYLQIEN